MIEEMLAARGIVVSHKTVRQWALKFGQEFTNRIRRRLPQAGDKFALSEVPAARQLGPAAAGLGAPHLIGTAKRFFRPVPVCAAAVDLGQPVEQIGSADLPWTMRWVIGSGPGYHLGVAIRKRVVVRSQALCRCASASRPFTFRSCFCGRASGAFAPPRQQRDRVA
jgi:hypothetical protein